MDGLVGYYTRWNKEHPDDVDAMMRTARVLSAQRRLPEAEKWFRQAIAKAPTLAEPRLALAEALAADDHYDQAAMEMGQLVELKPDNPDYIVRWGELVFNDSQRSEDQRRTEAGEIWRRMLRNRGDDPVTVARVVDLLRASGDVEAALEQYRAVIELAPAEPPRSTSNRSTRSCRHWPKRWPSPMQCRRPANRCAARNTTRRPKELEQIEASSMSRKQRDAVTSNLAKLNSKLGGGKQGQLSDAVQEIVDGLANENDTKAKQGFCKAAGVCRKQALRKKISECLGCQLNRLSACKGCCQGQCKKLGSNVAKSDTPSNSYGLVRQTGRPATKRPSSIRSVATRISPESKATVPASARRKASRKAARMPAVVSRAVLRIPQADGRSARPRAAAAGTSRNGPQVL